MNCNQKKHQIQTRLPAEVTKKILLKNIPLCNLNEKTDFSQFNEYLIHQNDDYVNAIFSILKSNNYNRPIKKDEKKTPIDIVFQDFFDDINRRVVFFSNPLIVDPFFIIKPNKNVYTYFQPLINWSPRISKLKIPIGQYMTNPQHFFIYCSHFFKKMIGDSINQIDLNEWCLSSEMPKAADIISDAIFDAVDVQSYFEPELGCLLMIISKLPYHPQADKSITPYVFENGFYVEINRSQNLFSYKIKSRDYFSIELISDSIKFQPNEYICAHFYFPFECNVIFNEQSILFDGDKLLLIENDQKISYITTDGVFVSKMKDEIIIDQYGTISQKIGNEWNSVTANSDSYINGKKTDSKSAYIVDYKTGIKSMIRPDRIEYYITSEGTRRILFNIGISIEQRNSSNIIYDIPNFPLITFLNGSFTLQMNNIDFTFSHNKTICIKNDLYSSKFDGEKLSIEIPHSEKIELKQNEIDIKFPTTTFHSDSINPNDQFESSIPQSDIQKKFPLRFFAIRSDFSGVEFVRKDSELLKDATFRASKIPHPYGGPVTVLGAHFKDIEKDPFIFIENSPINLPDDENELKKIFEDEDENVKIDSDRHLFVDDNISFARLLDSFLENENENIHAKYIDISEFNEDIQLPMPFNTPYPRLQNMQFNLHQEKIKDLKKGEVLNYFKSHASDFALIENDYEIIEEEEDEEEENDKMDGIEQSVNFNLKQYEISADDIEYTGQNIINDVPPPSFPPENDQ